MKESKTSNIIDHLKEFNRKERFHLIGQLLGNIEFKLSQDKLKEIFDLIELQIPKNYFSAMDYHLDWIYASLILTKDNNDEKKYKIEKNCIKATQEDVDFIIAFLDYSRQTHIIMIEAKGDTSFTNKQIISKAKRLQAIFGKKGDRFKNVTPYFLLCSPKKPKNLKLEEIPSFMKNKNQDDIIWFELNLPKYLKKVTRCNEEKNKSKDGKYWKVKRIK